PATQLVSSAASRAEACAAAAHWRSVRLGDSACTPVSTVLSSIIRLPPEPFRSRGNNEADRRRCKRSGGPGRPPRDELRPAGDEPPAGATEGRLLDQADRQRI